MVPNVDPGDFPFKSYFIESTIQTHQECITKRLVEILHRKYWCSTIRDERLRYFKLFRGYRKIFPNTKLTQQNLIDVYEVLLLLTLK